MSHISATNPAATRGVSVQDEATYDKKVSIAKSSQQDRLGPGQNGDCDCGAVMLGRVGKERLVRQVGGRSIQQLPTCSH